MSTLMATLRRILGAKTSFSPLEKLILDSVNKELPPKLRDVWREQIETVNKIQRLPGGVESDFYRMKSGRPDNTGVTPLPNMAEEWAIAKVVLTEVGTEKRIGATVWSVKGFLFSVEYDSDSRYFAESLGSEYMDKLTISCTILGLLPESPNYTS
jgi:hypothetical protein